MVCRRASLLGSKLKDAAGVGGKVKSRVAGLAEV